MKIFNLIVFSILLYSFNLSADDKEEAKKNVLQGFSDSLSSAIAGLIGGEGDTEIQITIAEEYHPEFSIMTVRPLAAHPGVDAWFVQIQLNDTKIRGKRRFAFNSGVGYRKLSENKNSMLGANLFLDYDEEGNSRSSLGLELRSTAFEAIANYYAALSGANTVGSYTERSLDGFDISLIGEVPYLPWANIIATHYEWTADKNSKSSQGDKLSLELVVTPNIIIEGGVDDNNIDGTSNFAKAYFVFPARNRVAASNKLIGESAFSVGDMSGELLSKVRRTNKQAIESEGSGVVMAKTK